MATALPLREHVDWVRPRVSAEGVAAYGEGHWANYLKIPHALYVDCVV